LPANVHSNESQQRRFTSLSSIPRNQQSTQYAALQERLRQYYGAPPQTDADRAREFNRELRMRQQAQSQQARAQVQPQQPTAGTMATNAPPAQEMNKPGIAESLNNATKGIPGPTNLGMKPLEKPKPEQIKSMKTLVKAKGLLELMTQAEDLMKQGKYISAIDQY